MSFKMSFPSPPSPFNSMPDPFTVLKGYKLSSEAMASAMMEKGKTFISTAVAFNKFVHAEMNPDEEMVVVDLLKEDVPSILTAISPELLFYILEYLPPRDLALVVSQVCPHLEFSADHLLVLLWESHYRRVWDEFPLPPKSSSQLRRLYPFCRKPIIPVFVAGKEIICRGNTVEFTGTIGEANRSVIPARAFPALQSIQSPKIDIMNSCSLMFRELSLAMKGGRKKNQTGDFVPANCLFASPFAYQGMQKQLQWYNLPRAVAYFEVSIGVGSRPRTQGAMPPGFEDLAEPMGGGPPECIAVGMATYRFALHSKLPGWDSQSFGYHGDDGAIFHGQGKHLSSYGPTYGLHDTIGCGVNYVDRSIFFTLNGAYLGVAFSEVSLTDELYPVVGIDASYAVSWNFGATPFKFDLCSFINLNNLSLTL